MGSAWTTSPSASAAGTAASRAPSRITRSRHGAETAGGPEGRRRAGLVGGVRARRQDAGHGCEEQTVKLWDVASGKELATLRGHTGTLYDVAFFPDRRTVARGSLDGKVRLWEAPGPR